MSARPARDLISHVEDSIRDRRLLRDGQRVLVAVSGGLDSMVLLHLLHRLASKHRWALGIAHFNHQLRAAASDADARFVAREARRLGLKFTDARWPKAEHRSVKEFGLEMAARLARHQFLANAAQAFRCRTIALAHHADDQVELCFLRLLRGAGGEGLAGMKWSGRDWAAPGLTLVRPLLDLTKARLEAFACEHGLRHREDATNHDRDRDRNWLRHELLPRIARRFGPAPTTTVLRTMELVGADTAFAQRAAEEWLAARRRGRFERLHPAVQRHVVRLQLRRQGIAAEFDLVERLRLRPGQPLTVAAGSQVLRDKQGRVLREDPARTDFDPDASIINFTRDAGRLTFAGAAIAWRIKRGDGTTRRPRSQAGGESFDAASVGARIRLRHWQPGDRFQPIGLDHAVKLQDLFTNLKIATRRRRTLVVAEASNGEIFWVEGVRIGEKFKLTPRTRRRLDWRWRRAGPSASAAGR